MTHRKNDSAAAESDVTAPCGEKQLSSGFPSPAQDYFEPMLNLNEALTRHPSSTFYGRVKGFSMQDAGIAAGDLLVIDKSLVYRPGALAVCFINGEFTLRKIGMKSQRLSLLPANPDQETILINAETELMIWGIVTHIIKETS